jgi:hypothetical protein
MSTVYIEGTSKVDINRRLAAGEEIIATEYHPYDISTFRVNELRDGTIVKVFSKMVDGNPYAKAYGVIKNGKVT